jgi:TolB-like protein
MLTGPSCRLRGTKSPDSLQSAGIPDLHSSSSMAPQSATALSPGEVRGQLDRILGHRDFEASVRTREFLRFVVEEALAGRAERLKGYTIAVEVFGRPKDFDANLDPIVRIQAGRLRRALEHYYLVAGGQDPVVISVPKGGYAPEFGRSESASGLQGSPAESPFDLIPRLPLGVAVAVLPLRELAVDQESRFFAEGLRDEFCQELSRYQSLVVIPCPQDMLQDAGGAGHAGLSRRLGARFLLQGSVRRGEDQIKVSAWLIDGPGGQQVWSQSFTSPLSPDRLIETQAEIARSVSAVIGSELGIISQRVAEEARQVPPASLGTYEALLRFYDYQITLDPGAGQQCAVALQAAAEREPEHGPLWSGLATLLQQAYMLDRPGAQDPGGQAAEYAQRGAALAPGSQLARGVLARNHFLQRERAAFLRETEVALRLNPGSPVFVGTAGYSLILAGDGRRGRPLLERAIASNPCHPGWFNHALCVDDYMRGDYESALQQTLKPAFEVRLWGPVLRAAVFGQLGRTAEAGAAASEILALVPDFEARAWELTHRPILSDEIVASLLEGLRKAGLRVE